MDRKTLTIAALVVVAVIVAFFFVGRASVTPEFTAGSTPTGTQNIEDYVPIVKYNGGLYTALPIQTTSDLTAVAGTFSGAMSLTSSFTLGSSGTAVTGMNVGTTTLIGAGANTYQVTASSTKAIDFTCTGITSNFVIDAWFHPTSTPTFTNLGWTIAYAKASTTANTCTAYVTNGTGATATIPTDYASSTAYEAWEI